MVYRLFIVNEKIKFYYPNNWIDKIEEDGTYLFYDDNFGSFRMTVLKIDNPNFSIEEYLKK